MLESLPALDPERGGVCRSVERAKTIAISADHQLSAPQFRLYGVRKTQTVGSIDGMTVKLKEVMTEFSCVYFF